MARDPLAARAAFLEAGAFFARLVADVEELAEHSHDDVWARPGLGAWDVRALTGHTSRVLVTLATYLGTPATEELCTSTGRYYALAGAAADPYVHRFRDVADRRFLAVGDPASGAERAAAQ